MRADEKRHDDFKKHDHERKSKARAALRQKARRDGSLLDEIRAKKRQEMQMYRAKKKQRAAKDFPAVDPIEKSLNSPRSEAAKKSKKRQHAREKRQAMREKIKHQEEKKH